MKKLLWLIGLLTFAALANAQTKDTTKTIDSVSIRLSLQEYQSYMQTLSEAIRLSREAKKASEAATVPVFILQVYEGLQEKAKPVYKTKSK